MKLKYSKRRMMEAIQGYSFILPALIIILTFTFAAIMFALYLSFQKVNLFASTYDFIGFENYSRMLEDEKSFIAFKNTLKFVSLVVPIQTTLALVTAAVLNSKVKGKKIFRILFFLPTLTSSAALTMIFMFMFSITGPVSETLQSLNFIDEPINFLNDPKFALNVIVAMNIWSTVPFFMTVYLAALQEVPKALYESAEIDGATPFKKFWHVTVPHLKPVTTFVLLMGIIGTFQMFDQAYIFSNGSGGPENSTLTVALLVYRNAFGELNTMGYASAIAITLGVIIFVVSIIAQRLNKSESLYS